jgi:hypothetical protein
LGTGTLAETLSQAASETGTLAERVAGSVSKPVSKIGLFAERLIGCYLPSIPPSGQTLGKFLFQ